MISSHFLFSDVSEAHPRKNFGESCPTIMTTLTSIFQNFRRLKSRTIHSVTAMLYANSVRVLQVYRALCMSINLRPKKEPQKIENISTETFCFCEFGTFDEYWRDQLLAHGTLHEENKEKAPQGSVFGRVGSFSNPLWFNWMSNVMDSYSKR